MFSCKAVYGMGQNEIQAKLIVFNNVRLVIIKSVLTFKVVLK